MEKHLWVIEWSPGNANVIPSPKLCPDLNSLEVVVADEFFTVVEASHDEVATAIRDFPYWRNAGHPADGRYVGSGGEELYILAGKVVTLPKLCDGLGLDLANFATEDEDTWEDIDPDILYNYIPTF